MANQDRMDRSDYPGMLVSNTSELRSGEADHGANVYLRAAQAGAWPGCRRCQRPHATDWEAEYFCCRLASSEDFRRKAWRATVGLMMRLLGTQSS